VSVETLSIDHIHTMCQQTYAICLLCHYPNIEILITLTECNEFREGIPSNHSASRDRMCADHDPVHAEVPGVWASCGDVSTRKFAETGWVVMPPRNCLRWVPKAFGLIVLARILWVAQNSVWARFFTISIETGRERDTRK